REHLRPPGAPVLVRTRRARLPPGLTPPRPAAGPRPAQPGAGRVAPALGLGCGEGEARASPCQERRGLGTGTGQRGERRARLLFLVITVLLFPLRSVMIVGGYGFAVWVYQMFAGPPGPPAG